MTLLYLLTACTDGTEASSDSNGQGEGKEIPVSIMPKLVAGDENVGITIALLSFSRHALPILTGLSFSQQSIDRYK